MSLTKPYYFTDTSKYSYNSNEISLASTYAKLKLINNPGLTFTQEFTNDTGFTYNSDFIEFVAGMMRQKDKRPSGSKLYASFTDDKDSDWGDGNLTNSLIGGATWDSGTIDLTGVSSKRFYMPGTGGNFDTVGSAGCIRFKYISNYNGLIGIRNILEYDAATGNNNAIFITHNGANIIVDLRDSAGAQHLMIAGGVNFVQGQGYVIELNFDFNGTSRVFIDGIQKASLDTSAWTRAAEPGTFKWGGATGGGDFWLDDVILFDSVQHTTDHAGELPYTYYTNIYMGSTVTMPETECPGPGTIVSFDSFVAIEVGVPKFIIQINRSGNYLYWDGAAWSISNETYAQANDSSTFNANVSTLPVTGSKYGQIKIIFDDSNTISYIDQTTCSLTNQIYPVDNPKIIFNETIRIEELIDFISTATIAGNDNVKFILNKNGIPYYHNGAAWVVSNGLYAQSNTAAEILLYITTFTTESVSLQISMFLHSNDGTTTPTVFSVIVEYDFVAEPGETLKTIVYGRTEIANGIYNTDPFIVRLAHDVNEYNSAVQIRNTDIYVEPRPNGYWEVELADTDTMESGSFYYFIFPRNSNLQNSRIEKRTVPQQDSIAYNSLPEAT